MNLERFYELRNWLWDAHRTKAQAAMEAGVSNSRPREVSPLAPSGNQEPACSLAYVRIHMEQTQPESRSCPPAYHLKLTPPEVHTFCHQAHRGARVLLQSELNAWGAAKKLALEADSEGFHRASIVSSGSDEPPAYRFLQDDRPRLDQGCLGLSFLPQVGVCSRLDISRRGFLSLPLEVMPSENVTVGPGEESSDNGPDVSSPQATQWVPADWPDWLEPLPDQALPGQGPGLLRFQLDLSAWQGEAQQGRLLLRPTEGGDDAVECALWLEPDGRVPYLEPNSVDIKLNGLFSQGQKIPLRIPVRFHGEGDLRVRVMGSGVHFDQQFKLDGHHPEGQCLEIEIDTKALPARLGQRVQLYLQTDSKIPNRRAYSLWVTLDLARLDMFPFFRLDWRDAPWGVRLEKRVEFRRRDTGEEARQVEVNIPPELACCLSAETSFEAENEVVFYLDSDRLNEGELVQGEVEVVARFDHGVTLYGLLPVLASTHTTQAALMVSKTAVPSGPVVEISFRNQGSYPLYLSEVNWQKNRFRLARDPLGPMDKPLLTAESGKSLRLIYEPVSSPRWLLPRWVRDVLVTKSNWDENPELRKRITLFMPPALLRPFVYRLSRKPKAEK